MRKQWTGKLITVGDNVDTDQIYPGRYLALTDPSEIASHCLEGVEESLAVHFPPGGMVVAGRNFGCGSSREHAVIALRHMGATAVLADSFARIFYRNAVNLGLVPVICQGLRQHVQSGQTLALDLEKGTVTVEETGEVFACEPLGDQAWKILEAGGLKPLMRARYGKKAEDSTAERAGGDDGRK